jgi:hypothetical protein
MTTALDSLFVRVGFVAQIPLAPPLHTRLIALVVIEIFLITTAVLLYIRWVQLKEEPLDRWWSERQAAGFSPRTRALMQESERERMREEGRPEDGPEPGRPVPPEGGTAT